MVVYRWPIGVCREGGGWPKEGVLYEGRVVGGLYEGRVVGGL